ncbi:sigma-54 interaction domain protein [Eubacterium nodatum ATCC 33099]|nr:sigma-54 interaction domain protein [Eubacterium nodatum ATCC 33099]
MEKNFGLDRVLEPPGVFPPVAWKLDNSWEIRPGEARVSLDRINVEWDSFQQICNSCGYKEDKIKARILDIVDKRGKFQNPFTHTGGLMMGEIEAVHESFDGTMPISTGDKIYCITSLGCLPMHIDEIAEIDYNYGQIRCKGYMIIFESSPIYPQLPDFNPNYILAALDEAGNIYGTYTVTKKNNCKNVVILGSNPHTMLMYAAAMREAIGPSYRVTGLMDKYYNDFIPRKEIADLLSPLFKDIYFINFGEPIDSYNKLKPVLKNIGDVDLVIVTDDVSGTETVAVQIVKQNGAIYFTSSESNYSIAVLCAEAINKVITTYAFDQYIDGYLEFTRQILQVLRPKLEDVDKLYKSYSGKNKITKTVAKSMALENTGRSDGFVYRDIVTENLVDEVMNVAGYDCNVIIQGETGVGKEKVLELIHQNSARYNKPCVKINCATIAESLAESEFFGYEKGAFTGAQSTGKAGYFELANDGILFLDEIGTLSMSMQSKLLRVLQENQFYRVGGTKQINVNVRVICANNISIRELVDRGKFREDLYYRLNICTLEVPPLRERSADIIALSEAFVAKYNRKYGVEKELSPRALNVLHSYYWPGNVRELENIIHRLIISSQQNVIHSEKVEELLNGNAYGDLVKSVKTSFQRTDRLDFHKLMDEQERHIIEYALKKEKTTRKAAALLGLPQTTLARKKLKHGL